MVGTGPSSSLEISQFSKVAPRWDEQAILVVGDVFGPQLNSYDDHLRPYEERVQVF